LAGQNQEFESRTHFYGVAAHLMRIILVDHARSRAAAKRGGAAFRIQLDDFDVPAAEPAVDLLALDEALDRLAAFDNRKARAVELRYFAGLGVEETAAALGVSIATVRRELRFAESWLYRELTAT
jgi:RNA polymerase sigma factor (TIGR02999 family)